MDNVLLRTAAFELHATNTDDVVKVAGVLRKIKNWWKAFTDEAYREEVTKLRTQSSEINDLLNEFQTELEKLQKSISDVDVYDYGNSLDKVRNLSTELSAALNKFYSSVDHAEKVVPTKTVSETLEPKIDEKQVSEPKVDAPKPKTDLPDEKEYVVHYNINQWKNKEFRSKLSEQKAEGNDVPVSNNIKKPVQSFKWFQQFSHKDVDAGDNFINAFIIRLASELSRKQDIFGNLEQSKTYYEMILRLPEVESQLVGKLISGVLNGKLERYSPAKPSAIIKERPAGEMTAAINVDRFEVTLPKGDVFEQNPTILISAFVLANDLRNAFVSRGDLSLSGIIHVRIVGTSRLERQVSPEEKKQQTQPNPPKQKLKEDEDLPEDYQEDESMYGDHNEFWDQFGDCNDKFSGYEDDEVIVKTANLNASKAEWKIIKIAYANPHEWARNILHQAFLNVMGREPTLAELQGAQAVAQAESQYGQGWKGTGAGSNNWGAVQSGSTKGGVCPAGSFLYTDTHPTASGTSVKYQVCFKAYPTPLAGAEDLIRILYKGKRRGAGLQNAAAQGSLSDFSKIMYDTGYYEGFGKDREARINNHIKYLQRHLNSITKALKEEQALKPGQNFNQPKQEITQPMETPKQITNQEPEQVAVQQDYDELIQQLFASGPVEKFVRTAIERSVLPMTSTLIVLKSDNFPCLVRYAHVLTSVLRSEIAAETSIHSNGEDIEIECDLAGTEKSVLKAVNGLSVGVSEIFKDTTGKNIDTFIYSGISSKMNVLKSDDVENNFRKFAFEMLGSI